MLEHFFVCGGSGSGAGKHLKFLVRVESIDHRHGDDAEREQAFVVAEALFDIVQEGGDNPRRSDSPDCTVSRGKMNDEADNVLMTPAQTVESDDDRFETVFVDAVSLLGPMAARTPEKGDGDGLKEVFLGWEVVREGSERHLRCFGDGARAEATDPKQPQLASRGAKNAVDGVLIAQGESMPCPCAGLVETLLKHRKRAVFEEPDGRRPLEVKALIRGVEDKERRDGYICICIEDATDCVAYLDP